MAEHLTQQEVEEQKLDILAKYKSDLAFLESGRDKIIDHLSHSNMSNEDIDKRLARLNHSIETLESLIEQFEEQPLPTPDRPDTRFIFVQDDEEGGDEQ